LKQKLTDLRNKGLLTGVLHEWADMIRFEANAAIHELTGSKEDANEMVRFIRFYLQYVYELPYEIAKVRNTDTVVAEGQTD
jgi:hypothetical protein